MSQPNKCFCDIYNKCCKDPATPVTVGYDAVNDAPVVIPGAEFVDIADRTCPGTRLFLSNTALGRELVIDIDETTIRLPRSAFVLQCEYFNQVY